MIHLGCKLISMCQPPSIFSYTSHTHAHTYIYIYTQYIKCEQLWTALAAAWRTSIQFDPAEYLVHILHHRLGNLFDDLSDLSLDHLHDPFLVGDLRHFHQAVNLGKPMGNPWEITPWKTHGFTPWKTHGFTHWKTHGFTHWKTHGFTHWKTHGFTHWKTHGFTHWKTHGFTHWKTHGFTHWKLIKQQNMRVNSELDFFLRATMIYNDYGKSLSHVPIGTSLTSTYHHLLPPPQKKIWLSNGDTSRYFIYSNRSSSFLQVLLQVAYSIFGTSTVFST